GVVAAELTGDSAHKIALYPGPYLLKTWRGARVSTARLKLLAGENRRIALEELVDEPAPTGQPRATLDAPTSSPDGGRHGTSSHARGEACLERCLIDVKERRIGGDGC